MNTRREPETKRMRVEEWLEGFVVAVWGFLLVGLVVIGVLFHFPFWELALAAGGITAGFGLHIFRSRRSREWLYGKEHGQRPWRISLATLLLAICFVSLLGLLAITALSGSR